MNEREIEERFRALDEDQGQSPSLALRQFVRRREFATMAKESSARQMGRSTRTSKILVGIAAVLVLAFVAGTAWITLRHAPTIGSTTSSPTASATASLEPTPTPTFAPTESAAPSPTRSPSPSPAPTPAGNAGAYSWRSYSWPFSATDHTVPTPQFGLPVPSGGYFGACDTNMSHAEWRYVGYPYCTSPDGLHWTESTSSQFKDVYIGGIAHGKGIYVMAGGDKITGKAAIFRSKDAVHWTRLSDEHVPQVEQSLTWNGSTMHQFTPIGGLVHGPAGFVAVGYHEDWNGGPIDTPSVLWHSPDGLTWTPLKDSPARTYPHLWSAGGRYFLGGIGTADASGLPLWSSSDALTWRRVTTVGAGQMDVVDLVYQRSPNLLIAYVRDSQGAASMYSSVDRGQTWRRSPGTADETCGSTNIQIRDGTYSLDGGTTWRTVEISGPPFMPDPNRGFSFCGVDLGSALFGYAISSDEMAGMSWIGVPR